MKAWFLGALDGAIGFVVKGLIAAIVGAAVAIGYDEAWKHIYHIPWLLFFANKVMAQMDPAVLKALTPTAIGVGFAGAAYAGLQGWFISHLKGGIKIFQRTINASDVPITVKVDGIALPGGETVQALQKITDIAGVEVRRATAVDPNIQAQVDHTHPIT